MKKTARIIAALLAIVMITGCSSKKAAKNFEFTTDADGVTITGYKGEDLEVEIPSEIDGKKVIAVGDNAFDGAKITAVTVPDSVTTIHPYAFTNCLALKSAKLGKGITSLSEGVFAYDTALENITFDADIEAIGLNSLAETAFSKSSEFVTIGDGILVAYNGKGGDVVVPDGVKNVGTVFTSNTVIKSITLPESVTEIPNSAFSGCAQLRDVTLPSKLKLIGTSAFASCYALNVVEIPASVTEISDLVFMNCVSLRQVTIPDSVATFGDEIFKGDSNVTIVTPNESAAFGYAAANGIAIAE